MLKMEILTTEWNFERCLLMIEYQIMAENAIERSVYVEMDFNPMCCVRI
jgi:hypothetical protein